MKGTYESKERKPHIRIGKITAFDRPGMIGFSESGSGTMYVSVQRVVSGEATLGARINILERNGRDRGVHEVTISPPRE